MSKAITPEIQTGIEQTEQWAKSLVVSTSEQRNEAVEIVRQAKSYRKKIVEFFADTKDKAHKTWKAIVAQEKSFTDRIDAIELSVKKTVRQYDDKVEQERRKEQARLQAIADEQARRERERLIKEAEKLKTPELREQRLEEAEELVAPVVMVEEPEKQKKESTVSEWKARVVKLSIVPREYLVVNQQALDALAKATKGSIELPGVEFYEYKTLRINL